jgi:hypothetical protein
MPFVDRSEKDRIQEKIKPYDDALDPEAAHGDLSDKVMDFMATWIRAVFGQRLPSTGTTLRVVGDSPVGWATIRQARLHRTEPSPHRR